MVLELKMLLLVESTPGARIEWRVSDDGLFAEAHVIDPQAGL